MIEELRERIGIDNDMPYGGIPYSKILPKYEKTDPRLLKVGADAVYSNYNSNNNIQDESLHETFVRKEITDWSTDVPLFESDHARRDPSLSRSQINLRYNGNRGNTSDLPRHPELFIGFTGNDPRGAVNDPRFDKMRGFITSSASNLEVSMGKNDDNHLAERPWTNQSLSYDKKYVQQLSANNMKIFTAQKEGRPYSRNVITDLPTWGKNQNKIRKSNMTAGDETVDINKRDGYGEYIDIGGEVNQILSNDLQKISLMNAPSTVSMNETSHLFDTQMNNFNPAALNNQLSNNIGVVWTNLDHVNIDSLNAPSNNNNNLASSMALAAKTAAVMKNINSYNKQGMTNVSDQDIERDNINVQQKISGDIQNIYKGVEMNGQNYGISLEGQAGKGLIQKGGTGVNKNVTHDTNTNMAHKNAELTTSIVKGLTEGTNKRKLADRVIVHFTPSPIDNSNNNNYKSVLPSKDYIKNNAYVDSAIFKNAVSDNSLVNKYQLAPKREKKVHFGISGDVTNWNESQNSQVGKNVRYMDDHNRSKKGIQALSPTEWKNSFEMQQLMTKNPELYNKVKNDINMSVVDWKESMQVQSKIAPHEMRTPGMVHAGGKTYTPDTWHEGYNPLGEKKTLSLSKRRSAQNDPTVLGGEQNEIFKENNQSFAQSYGHSGPKTLRAGKWNTDEFVNSVGNLNNLTYRH